MCTLITIDQTFWNQNQKTTIARIRADALNNSEGWCLLALDPKNPDNDMRINTMKVNFIPKLISEFFLHSSNKARIFLHARAATTENVGIAFTHGFDDHHGRIIMHNGVIKNINKFGVDSFNLVTDYNLSTAESLLTGLEDNKETFANIFVIEPNAKSYSVVRMNTGSLYTDSLGNYSTNAIGTINTPVEKCTGDDHWLDEVETEYNWSDITDIRSVMEPEYRYADRYPSVNRLLWNEVEAEEREEWNAMEDLERQDRDDRLTGWKRKKVSGEK